MNTRIVFVADKSEAYVDFERDRILKDWGAEWSDARHISRLSEAGISSLFGDAPISILSLEDKETVKLTAELMKTASEGDMRRWGTPGVIILTSVDRTSTRTLEKLVKDAGGEVVLAKENSKDKVAPAARLVDELSISREAKAFLKDYAGDDYSSILSLLKTLGDLNPRQQQAIGIEDLLVRLPQAPGAVPPWEIEPALMSGNVTRAIELYRRVSTTSHYLVVLAVLKNKLVLVFKAASLIENTPGMNLEKLSKQLGVPNNYPLRLAFDSAKRLGARRATSMVELAASTEAKVKGGSSANSHVLMESMLTQLAFMAKS